MRTAGALILWVGLSLLTGFAGGLAAVSAPEFYARLDKPSWAPPAAIFGPVWSALYLMMGVAAFLVWRSAEAQSRRALIFFAVHLAVNGLWSWLFFRWHLGAASLAEIVVLWLMIAVLAVWFWRLQTLAAVLLMPYLAWVTFATALTFSLWRRNPTLL